MLSGRCNVEQMEDRLTCYRHPGVEGLVSTGLLELGGRLSSLDTTLNIRLSETTSLDLIRSWQSLMM